jgi:hypothetical protein
MRIRLLLGGCLLLAVAACSGNEPSHTAATTTVAPTTTLSDPAATACRQLDSNVEKRPKEDPALDQLTISRDPRIVAAARQVEQILQDRNLDPNAVPADLDLEYASAVLELVRACKVAGFLP